MTPEEQKEINELANDLAYQRLRFSRLWNAPETRKNGQIDSKANDFAALLMLHLEELIAKEELELERKEEAA